MNTMGTQMASSTDEDVGIAVAFYLLSESGEKKRKLRFPSHPINKERGSRVVMAKLFPQLCDDQDKFYNYTRMSLPSTILHMHTNWQHSS